MADKIERLFNRFVKTVEAQGYPNTFTIQHHRKTIKGKHHFLWTIEERDSNGELVFQDESPSPVTTIRELQGLLT